MWHSVNLSTFFNPGRTLYFGGGAVAPTPPPAPAAPPKPEVPDNSAAQLAMKKKGLQSTLLTNIGSTNGGLGGSSTMLGNSTTPYTGED